MTEKRSIDDIQCKARFRREEGDLAALIESIRVNGLLHPIVIAKDGTLIAGKRRLAACCALGWAEVPVTIVEPPDFRLAEADENRVRLNLTPKEALAVKRFFEPIEKAAAKERKQAGVKIPSANFAQGGKSRDKVAELTGYSHETLRKAELVEEAAENEPEKFTIVLQEMDETGKVDPAYKKVKAKKAKPKRDYEGDAIYLEGIKRSYLGLSERQKKLFRKWLTTVD